MLVWSRSALMALIAMIPMVAIIAMIAKKGLDLSGYQPWSFRLASIFSTIVSSSFWSFFFLSLCHFACPVCVVWTPLHNLLVVLFLFLLCWFVLCVDNSAVFVEPRAFCCNSSMFCFYFGVCVDKQGVLSQVVIVFFALAGPSCSNIACCCLLPSKISFWSIS